MFSPRPTCRISKLKKGPKTVFVFFESCYYFVYSVVELSCLLHGMDEVYSVYGYTNARAGSHRI